MKKEIEIDLGVFVPLQKETADVPRALKNAGEILHRVLCGSYLPMSDTHKKEGKQTPLPPKSSDGVSPITDAPKSAQPASPMPLDSIVRGQVLPENRSFRTQLNIGTEDRQTIENTVLELFSLQLTDRQEAITAGMEANLKIQKKILRAVQGMHMSDGGIARANIRNMRKTASAEGGVL